MVKFSVESFAFKSCTVDLLMLTQAGELLQVCSDADGDGPLEPGAN